MCPGVGFGDPNIDPMGYPVRPKTSNQDIFDHYLHHLLDSIRHGKNLPVGRVFHFPQKASDGRLQDGSIGSYHPPYLAKRRPEDIYVCSIYMCGDV